jgi:Transglycosylase SLT domain
VPPEDEEANSFLGHPPTADVAEKQPACHATSTIQPASESSPSEIGPCSWEPWHFGYGLNAGTTSVGFGDGRRLKTLPDFVPAALQSVISLAAQRWNVSGALLAAQLYAESNFNPFAESSAGAQGVAQFMPGTAQAYGVSNPFDPADSIDGQAHLMRDLLRRFASVPLALAAYNAGPAPVAACGCIPPIPETQAYVAKILGLLGGAGEGPATLEVRLIE